MTQNPQLRKHRGLPRTRIPLAAPSHFSTMLTSEAALGSSQARRLCFLRQEAVRQGLHWRGSYRLIKRSCQNADVHRACVERGREGGRGGQEEGEGGRDRHGGIVDPSQFAFCARLSFKESRGPGGEGERRVGDLIAYRWLRHIPLV